LPRELTDKLWNATAESFQSVEAALQRTGDAQLYADCEQAGREAIALIMPAAGKSLQEPAVRKKDF